MASVCCSNILARLLSIQKKGVRHSLPTRGEDEEEVEEVEDHNEVDNIVSEL